MRLYSVLSTHDRVEVLYSGRWGTVCNEQWSVLDGEVVCGQLGYDVSLTDVPLSFTPNIGYEPYCIIACMYMYHKGEVFFIKVIHKNKSNPVFDRFMKISHYVHCILLYSDTCTVYVVLFKW